MLGSKWVLRMKLSIQILYLFRIGIILVLEGLHRLVLMYLIIITNFIESVSGKRKFLSSLGLLLSGASSFCFEKQIEFINNYIRFFMFIVNCKWVARIIATLWFSVLKCLIICYGNYNHELSIMLFIILKKCKQLRSGLKCRIWTSNFVRKQNDLFAISLIDGQSGTVLWWFEVVRGDEC